MHIYTVHQKPGAQGAEELPVFVREGFTVWGFVFTLFWTLYQRLWLASLLIIAFNIGLMALRRYGVISEVMFSIVMLGEQLIIGFHGHDWLRAALRRRGYITSGIVSGETRLRAELRFFEHYTAQPA